MQELSRKKIVKSIKGPNGGFFMTKEDLGQSIADIVKAIDGESIYSDCVLTQGLFRKESLSTA